MKDMNDTNSNKQFTFQIVSQGKIKLNDSTDEFGEALYAVSKACRESGDQGLVIRVSDGRVMFQKTVT